MIYPLLEKQERIPSPPPFHWGKTPLPSLGVVRGGLKYYILCHQLRFIRSLHTLHPLCMENSPEGEGDYVTYLWAFAENITMGLQAIGYIKSGNKVFAVQVKLTGI